MSHGFRGRPQSGARDEAEQRASCVWLFVGRMAPASGQAYGRDRTGRWATSDGIMSVMAICDSYANRRNPTAVSKPVFGYRTNRAKSADLDPLTTPNA